MSTEPRSTKKSPAPPVPPDPHASGDVAVHPSITAAIDALATQAPTFKMVPFESLFPSTTNPRKTFDKADLEEMAKTIREHGIVEPLVVRPMPGRDSSSILLPGDLQIVAGERRWRAAKLAQVAEVPVMVHDLTDRQALELQVVENLQRKDLHPLEEADGLRTLHEIHNCSVDELAAKVGMSKGSVYARLKLNTLAAAARKAFLEGKLSSSTALLIARIPVPELQEQAMKEITKPAYYGGDFELAPMSYRKASDHIQQKYMLRLAEAPFKTADATLVPAAGPCTTCPKRTGNQRELFEDVKSADVCTDPTCFGKKKEAAAAIRLEEARRTGQQVITGPEAKRIVPYEGSSRLEKGYVDLSEKCWQDPKQRTYKALLAKAGPAPILLDDPHTGRLREILPKTDLTKALKEAGHKFASPAPSSPAGASRSSTATTRKAEAARLKKEQADKRRLALGAVAAGIEKRGLADKDWRLLITCLMDYIVDDGLVDVAMRRGLVDDDAYDVMPPVVKHLDKLRGFQLQALLAEMFLSSLTDYSAGMRPSQKEAFKHFGVDLKKLEAQAKKGIHQCRNCGCTEDKACDVGGIGCSWLEEPDPKTGLGLCSAPACAKKHVDAKPAKKGKGRK